MSDANTSLPVRTENPGDVVTKIADATTPTQQLAIDASGRITTKMDDGAGNPITSQVNGAQQALDVGIDVGGVQIDPRQIRALTSADVVTVDQGTTPWITKDNADGSVTGGTAGTFSSLSGAQFNTTPPTLTTGQQAALQSDVNGNLKVDLATALPAGANNIGSVNQGTSPWVVRDTNFPTTVDTNYGTVGASTIRTAAQIGNASGAADFGNGATGAQTLRTAANLAVLGADVSNTNPVPVTIASSSSGTAVQAYFTTAALAKNASTTFTYTVAAAHTFDLERIWATSSGKIKCIVQNNGSTIFAAFNSTATPNIDITVVSPPTIAAGNTVTVTLTNDDVGAMDVYATIEGNQN